jgi:hypothetical protein
MVTDQHAKETMTLETLEDVRALVHRHLPAAISLQANMAARGVDRHSSRRADDVAEAGDDINRRRRGHT